MKIPLQTALVAAIALAGATAALAQSPGAETMLPMPQYTLQPPFIDESLGNKNWYFGGSTVVDISRHVRLTQDRRSQSGWMWSKEPLLESSYQIEFEYRIGGDSDALFGDGMAFWLTRERAEVGPVFGSRQAFTGLGVFFDTYANNVHRYSFPYVMGMLGDGQRQYDASVDGQTTELAGCPAEIRKRSYPTRCRLKYVAGHYLELSLNALADGAEWTPCFRVNATLPSPVYIGFSALTGDVSDSHDVVRVTVSQIAGSAASDSLPTVNHHGNDYGGGAGVFSRSNWNFHSLFYSALWLLVYAAVLVVVVYIVFRVYQRRQAASYKRF